MEEESRPPPPRRVPPIERDTKEEIEMKPTSPLTVFSEGEAESVDEGQTSTGPPQASVQPVKSLDENYNNIIEFVERNIFMRNCKYFIKNPRTQKCGCNRDENWHTTNKIPTGPDTSWSSDKHTSLHPTNAHGRIKLHGYGRLRAGAKPTYIRVNALMKEFDTIWDLMINHWGVPEPKIVLSINGGAKKMVPMTQRLRVALKKGLMNVSSAARTWFITSGFNLGVAKLVGEAVRDYSLASTNDNSFVAIGLATWGAVYNRHQLINSTDENATDDGMHIADYYNCKENPGKGQAVLDPHHTHFILCDDGSERSFNKELNFRAEFENFIHKKMVSMMKSGSPVVQVVIEGGKKTIETAYFALMEETPVVVIRGSGRCADLICELLESVNPKTPVGNIKMKILDQLNCYREDWNITSKEFERYSKQLLSMTQEHRHLMHVFNVDGVSKELDRAILLAVFRSSNNMTAQMRLSLSMDMNRCDLAAQEIFSDDKVDDWKNLDLDNAMFNALRKGQTGFVELFLDHGISIENFLTKERLTHLYHHALMDIHTSREAEELREIIENIKTPWWNYLVKCCRKSHLTNMEKDLLIHVGRVIQIFTGDTMPNPYTYSDENLTPHVTHVPEQVEVVRVSTCGGPFGGDGELTARQTSHQPEFIISGGRTIQKKIFPVYPPRSFAGKRLYTEQDLFFWAVLFNQMDLAKLFWRMGKDHIGSALVACAIFDQLQARAESDGEMELAHSLEKNSDYFEMLATGILSVAYHEDKDRTHLLLIRCLPYYGNETLLSLADQNECMDFMSHTACQTKLNRIWMGGMSPYVPIWKIILNLLFSVFFIRLIFPQRDADMVSKNKSSIRRHQVDPQLPEKHMLHAEYIDQDAPNARELRETVAAQHAAANMDMKTRKTFLEAFRWRQQHSWKHVDYRTALFLYYTAPVTKFILNTISYVIFLLLLCYTIMVELKPIYDVPGKPSNCTAVVTAGRCIPIVELVVWCWIITLVVEEFRQIFMRDQRSLRYKLSDWISSGWNKFDFLMYMLFITTVVLRYTLSESQFIYTRSVYALMMSMFFLRFMQTYYAHPVIGPKVVMVTKMVNDILFFVALFIIFLLAYGTAAQALLYPGSVFTIDMIKKVVYYPYWQVFGELTLDEVEGKNAGETRNALVVVLFAIYMLFSNVLLLNLLIAMFGYTFENIQMDSRKIWAYNRYDLILEYFDRPFVPPPFIIFPIMYRAIVNLVAMCRRNCCRYPKSKIESDFKVMLDLHENQMMSAFEQQCMERLMTQLDNEETAEHFNMEAEKHDTTFHDRIDSIADQVSILKDIIDRKGRTDSVLGELSGTPRSDVDYTGFVNEVSMMRDRLRGLEDKLASQTKTMENIHYILQHTVAKGK